MKARICIYTHQSMLTSTRHTHPHMPGGTATLWSQRPQLEPWLGFTTHLLCDLAYVQLFRASVSLSMKVSIIEVPIGLSGLKEVMNGSGLVHSVSRQNPDPQACGSVTVTIK